LNGGLLWGAKLELIILNRLISQGFNQKEKRQGIYIDTFQEKKVAGAGGVAEQGSGKNRAGYEHFFRHRCG
jgi:hypothetical protein